MLDAAFKDLKYMHTQVLARHLLPDDHKKGKMSTLRYYPVQNKDARKFTNFSMFLELLLSFEFFSLYNVTRSEERDLVSIATIWKNGSSCN
jgi:hypothetical protein